MKAKWIGFVLFSLVFVGYSDVILGNLSNVIQSASSVYDSGDRPYVGNLFTTGSDGNYLIESIDISFGTHRDTTGDFELRLFSDDSNAPGTQLAVFTGSTSPVENTVERYVLAGGYNIDANTSYWVVALGINGSTDYGWNYTADTSSESSQGWTIGNSALINTDFSVGNLYSEPQIFSVNAVAVPEPSSVILLLGGAGLLKLFRRRLHFLC